MTVHVIGGGLAGLSAAVAAVGQNQPVRLYEAAPQLGGRCRTIAHSPLGCAVDNGTHIVVGANAETFGYLDRVGARDGLVPADRDGYAFFDLDDGRLGRLAPGRPVWPPWWLLDARRRPHGLGLRDMIPVIRLALARRGQTAAGALNAAPRAVRAVWQPFCTAVLNTPLAEADAGLLARTMRAMFVGPAADPSAFIAAETLSATFVAPAERFLKARGVTIATGATVDAVLTVGARVTALRVGGSEVALGDGDAVVLAVPPWSGLFAQLGLPTAELPTSPIVNVHYLLESASSDVRFCGLLGADGHWMLQRSNLLSVTASAGNQWLDHDGDSIAKKWWPATARALGLPREPQPRAFVVKERRATLRHAPAIEPLRPGAQTRFSNLALAGDWTATGLPCTIESAVRSGLQAIAQLRGPPGNGL